MSDAKYYVWEERSLYKLRGDGGYRRCLPDDEVLGVLHHCHVSTYDGHFGPNKTITKVLYSGFYGSRLFKDARRFVMSHDGCQRMGNIFKRHEMPQIGIFEV